MNIRLSSESELLASIKGMMPSIHTEELRGSPGSYWCLPRELVRCRTLFGGASPPGFVFWMLEVGMRIWFAQRRWHLELLELVYSFCCAKSRKILEYGNCRSHSRAPQMLGLIGNAVAETDTWCGNLWTSHSLRDLRGTDRYNPMQCSMVDECGAMKHMKRTLWWHREYSYETADLCHEHSLAQQVAWTPVLRAHLSQSPDPPAPRRQAAWRHQQPPGPNFQYLAVCSLGCHLTHTLEIADLIWPNS